MLNYSPLVNQAIVAVCKRMGDEPASVKEMLETNGDVDQQQLDEAHAALEAMRDGKVTTKHIACLMEFGSTVIGNM